MEWQLLVWSEDLKKLKKLKNKSFQGQFGIICNIPYYAHFKSLEMVSQKMTQQFHDWS